MYCCTSDSLDDNLTGLTPLWKDFQINYSPLENNTTWPGLKKKDLIQNTFIKTKYHRRDNEALYQTVF